ncbi:uncharacterized protein METZ01_LOCUS294758, partial [marine metagenome]
MPVETQTEPHRYLLHPLQSNHPWMST